MTDGGSDETRERILREALTLFYEHGYSGTSLGAIARQVGVSVPALYWYFASKQQLCFVAVHRELAGFVDALCAAGGAGTSHERLAGFVRAYVRSKLQQSQRLSAPGATASYGMLRDALEPAYQQHLDELQRQAVALLRGILEEGRERGDFRFADTTAAAFAITTMCEYVFVWVRPDGRFPDERVADVYGDLALAMVRGAQPADASLDPAA